MKYGGDWGFLGQLVKFVDELSNTAGVLLASLWNENHVTFHVSCGFVVLAVGNLPGEIWDKQGRVADPASCVVENLRRGERLMAALVSENPKASTEETLNDSVYSPEPGANWSRRNVFWGNEFIEEHKGDCKTGDVSSNIAQTPQTRSLEAVFRNCISNIIDRVVWKFELIPVCINELAIVLLLHII